MREEIKHVWRSKKQFSSRFTLEEPLKGNMR